MGAGEQFELTLQVEVKQSGNGRVRRDNASLEASVLGKLLEFLPMFVAAARRSGNRERQARLGSAF